MDSFRLHGENDSILDNDMNIEMDLEFVHLNQNETKMKKHLLWSFFFVLNLLVNSAEGSTGDDLSRPVTTK